MNKPEDIRVVTDKALYGLTADESLKFRILQKAAACNEKEVLRQLDGRIEAVVRGKAGTGVASTIIDCTGEELKCLREGTISYKEIEDYVR